MASPRAFAFVLFVVALVAAALGVASTGGSEPVAEPQLATAAAPTSPQPAGHRSAGVPAAESRDIARTAQLAARVEALTAEVARLRAQLPPPAPAAVPAPAPPPVAPLLPAELRAAAPQLGSGQGSSNAAAPSLGSSAELPAVPDSLVPQPRVSAEVVGAGDAALHASLGDRAASLRPRADTAGTADVRGAGRLEADLAEASAQLGAASGELARAGAAFGDPRVRDALDRVFAELRVRVTAELRAAVDGDAGRRDIGGRMVPPWAPMHVPMPAQLAQ